MDALTTASLTKHYGAKVALRDVSLRVPLGCRFGFLGPNGAGKTTAIRIFLGLLRPTGGRVEILGHDPWTQGPQLRRHIGYLPGDIRFFNHLTGRRTLEFFAAARKVDCREEIARLARVFDLDLDRRLRACSRGMKQKLGVIQALMHRPQLLILDEPTTALDPLVRQALYDELRAVTADGRTVLFSSHTLSEVEQLCDEVAILRDGRLVEQQRIEVLRRRAVRQVEIVFAAPPAGDPPPGLRVAARQGPVWRAVWSGPPGELMRWLAQQAVRDVTIAPPDLESLFMTYYHDQPEDAA